MNLRYHPTHVLIPMGEKFTLSPAEAATICKDQLDNCKTIVPLYYTEKEHRTTQDASSYDETGVLSQFKAELEHLQVFDRRVVYSELEVLGKWFDLLV